MNETFRFPHNDFLWVWSEIGLGIIFYVGMFAYALWSAKKYLVIGLLGYIVIAFFTPLADRTFPLVMMTVYIAMSCKRKPINQPQLLISILIFAMVVFGFRFRSSYWNKKVRKAKTPQAVLDAANGYSVFSTLTYTNFPWFWWKAKANFQLGNEDCIEQYRRAFRYSPYDIYVLNGMGLSYILEDNMGKANGFFKIALDICPDFKAAQTNFEVSSR